MCNPLCQSNSTLEVKLYMEILLSYTVLWLAQLFGQVQIASTDVAKLLCFPQDLNCSTAHNNDCMYCTCSETKYPQLFCCVTWTLINTMFTCMYRKEYLRGKNKIILLLVNNQCVLFLSLRMLFKI